MKRWVDPGDQNVERRKHEEHDPLQGGLFDDPKQSAPWGSVRDTQAAKVLAYIRTFGSITPADALREFKCYRLAARVYDLKEMGYDIRKTMEPHEGGEHARYTEGHDE